MCIQRVIQWGVDALSCFWQHLHILCRRSRNPLFVKIGHDGSVKIGTCQHCVVREQGRPMRAWNACGDTALDFPRDQLIGRLAEFGLQVEIQDEYVCP